MLEFMLFIFIVIIIFSLVINNIRIRNKNTELIFMLTQSYIDIESIKKKILNNEDSVEKDHLINFLTESRELAHSYIEDIQDNLKLFVDDLEADIVFLKEFNVLSEQDINYKFIKKVIDHYDKLKNMLPEEPVGR